MKSSTAEYYLILVAAIFGMTFPLLHNALKYISAGQLVFYRFLLSAFLFIPIINKELKETNIFVFLGSFGLALLSCGGYFFQTVGLETINASRAAFITGTSVLFVPFISPFFNLGWPQKIDFLSGLLCLFGLFLLTGSSISFITIGDFYVLVSAIFFSFMIVLIQWLTQKTNKFLLLTFYQIFFTAIAISPFLKINYFFFNWRSDVWLAILFCSLFATSFSLFTQIRVQQYTTATKAAMIFTLEPIFAYIFTWLLNGEKLLANQIFGGILILLSIVLPNFVNIYPRINKETMNL